MGSSENLENNYRVFERRLDRELWVVTATDGVNVGGLIATFVSQASIAAGAPRVLVGISKRHRTWELIEASGAFALHLLGDRHLEWLERFGLQSGRSAEKFEGLDHAPGRSGSPILSASLGWLDCVAEARFGTGDRTVYLAEVVEARPPGPDAVLTVQRMLSLVPDDLLRRLAEDRERDALADSEAIRSWRRGGRRNEPERDLSVDDADEEDGKIE